MRRSRLNRSIGASLAVIAASATHGDVLWDNGEPDGVGAYSNATSAVFGFRRTVLDDFVVPAGQRWTITGFRHRSVYNSGETGFSEGMFLRLRLDDDHEPGEVQFDFNVTDYAETPTGNIFFAREEVEHWTEVDPAELDPGHYWWEGAVIATENNFWLTSQVRESECWVNYDDLGGLMSGVDQFGAAAGMNGTIEGTVLFACSADLDGDGNVSFGDLLLVLGAWGECFHQSGCPEDIDESGVVDFGDILAVIQQWSGPCAPAITGACCFDDATCTEVTHAVCLSEGGRFLGLETLCADGCPGACCFDDGTCADGADADECVAALGHFAGEATRCADIDCPLIPVGACCLDDGTCAGPVSETNCDLLAGRYEGDDSDCADVVCAVLGSCGWIVDAPLTWDDNTCLNANTCGIRPTRDIQWEVTVPTDGTWTFSVCGALADTFLFVDENECCGNQHFNDDFCPPASQLTLDLAAGQTVFVTLETLSLAECGSITLVVSSR